MRLTRLIFALLLPALAWLPARAASSAADAPHVHVQLLVPAQTLSRGTTAEAGLYFKIEPGWHVYWQNAGDAGLPPRIRWTLPAGITAGPMEFPAPKRLPLGPLMDFGYENEVVFPLKLAVAKNAAPGTATLDANVDWLVCQATCIPGKAELQVSRPVVAAAGQSGAAGPDAALISRFEALLPSPLPAAFKAGFEPSQQGFSLAVATGRTETAATFFPLEQGVLDNPAAQRLTPTARGFVLDLKKDAGLTANPAALSGVLELAGGRSYAVSVAPGKVAVGAAVAAATAQAEPAGTGAPAQQVAKTSAATGAGFSLAGLMQSSALAFLGGLLLNLMPCVFPVLFLKGLALVQSGNEERRRLRAHGLVYTAGILVSFWALVAALLALRAAGSVLGWGFQFQSPVFLAMMAGLLFFLGLSLAGMFEIGLTLTSAGGSLAARQGHAGSFFTGVLAVVVATPCTAPLMGPAIGYALAQPAAVTFVVFTALALGLAAPYVALTMQPAWTRWLPKPGAWMEVLKQAVSVPIFATVIWLAWVLANTYGSALLAALLAGFLLLAIAGWFLGRWPAKRWATAVAAGIIAVVIAGNAAAPGKLATTAQAGAAVASEGWQPWSAEAVSRELAAGHPVFVDFTAKWCLSCQVNERVVLDQPEVQKALAEAHVTLLKADWTARDATIEHALAGLGRSGVPTYVLYAPGDAAPRVLPEVLTTSIVTDALAALPQKAGPLVSSSAKQ